jgi:translation initiation factor 5
MKTVNIPRTVDDPKYRYKMPLLQQKIEGKGINIRTNLTNLKDVAKSLRVPHDYILKFMGYEFGSNVNVKDNATSINGEMNENDILKMLDKFIDKYVLCPKCKLPEMVLQLSPEKQLIGKCNSCGTTTELDKKHKMTTYIIKNPPENRSEMKNISAVATNFETTNKSKLDLNGKRNDIRKMVAQSNLSPFVPEEHFIFERINEYLNLILPMNNDYEFDDGHVELVYKGIKRLRLDKIYYDRVGYILFNYIFNEGLLSQIDARATLLEEVLGRHCMKEFVGHEIILNLQFFLYNKYKEMDWGKKVPTILKKFYDQKLLTNVS